MTKVEWPLVTCLPASRPLALCEAGETNETAPTCPNRDSVPKTSTKPLETPLLDERITEERGASGGYHRPVPQAGSGTSARDRYPYRKAEEPPASKSSREVRQP